MIGRFFVRLIYAQAGWAKPFGDFNHRWLNALFRPIRPVKSFLNGKWLGHSVHAALTDVPIGVFTLAIIFDLLGWFGIAGGLEGPADIAIAFGILAMIAAAVAGFADYTDVDDHPRMVATVHATVMTVGLIVYIVSLVLRLGAPTGDRTAAIVVGLLGYLIVTAGAFVGGENVYALGDMVNRHAWRFGSTAKWTKLDVSEVSEGQPTKAKAGAQTLVLVRQGSTIYALHDQCAHAGGPLSEGRVVDGCIECPWHQSCYDLATGRRKSGPTTFDQPTYQVREAEGGGWEVLRLGTGTGQNL
jgi:nitrite reductase/ring-hydroxylating ferredoxin subunit/uncharacterized membrane protein